MTILHQKEPYGGWARLNANEHIEEFLSSLSCACSTLKTKRIILERFCLYIEETENLTPGKWNFDKAKEIRFKTISSRIPIDSFLISEYLSSILHNTKPSSYNTVLATLKEFCYYLMDKGVLFDNPTLNEKPCKFVNKNMTNYRLTLNESLKLLESAYLYDEHKNRNFSLVLIFLTSAIRIGELINLTENNIIWEYQYFNAYGKSGFRQRIFTPGLGESIFELIHDPLREKALKDSKSRFIFYSEKNGGPMSTDEINNLLKRFAKHAGLSKNISSYWLRRTYATILAQSGISVRTIQVLFDHDRIKNTEAYILELARMRMSRK